MPGSRTGHSCAGRSRFAATAGLAAALLLLVPLVDGAQADVSTAATDRGTVHRFTPAVASERTNRTTEAPVPVVADQEAVVEIPSLDVSLPVVPGGQRVIDKGVAAHYSAAHRRAVDPGRPGTYWLAAHGSTSGSPFNELPAIDDGAEVRITTVAGETFTYTVTSRERVGTKVSPETLYGREPTTPRLLLQTCQGSERLLVRGVLTAKASVRDP